MIVHMKCLKPEATERHFTKGSKSCLKFFQHSKCHNYRTNEDISVLF